MSPRGASCSNLEVSGKSLCVVQDADSSSWATVLAVVWLHAKAKHQQCEWELLEKKARTWINSNAGRSSVLRPHLLPSVGSWPSCQGLSLQAC